MYRGSNRSNTSYSSLTNKEINLYENFTLFNIKEKTLFCWSAIGLIYTICYKIDETIKSNNIKKDDINLALERRYQEKLGIEIKTKSIKTIKPTTLNEKTKDFYDNILIFNDFFKEFICSKSVELQLQKVNLDNLINE